MAAAREERRVGGKRMRGEREREERERGGERGAEERREEQMGERDEETGEIIREWAACAADGEDERMTERRRAGERMNGGGQWPVVVVALQQCRAHASGPSGGWLREQRRRGGTRGKSVKSDEKDVERRGGEGARASLLRL